MISPLTRRVLTVNILALGVLVFGPLYLGQYEQGLIEAEIESLNTQSQVFAGALGQGAVVDSRRNGENILPEVARPMLRRLVEPTRVAEKLNEMFQVDNGGGKYFTLLYGLMEVETGHVRLVSAGHPGPLVVKNGRGSLHKARPPAVGFLPDGVFSEQSLHCEPGDRLYFYTDGIFEVTNGAGEELGQEGVPPPVILFVPQYGFGKAIRKLNPG